MHDSATTPCLLFPELFDRPLTATFDVPNASSDGGAILTLPELLREAGLAQIAGVSERHRFLIEAGDEPMTAVGSLMVPLHVTIAMKDEVWPAEVT